MTGLWSHAAVRDILRAEMARAQRESKPVSAVLADLDHFKQINDTYGHLAGDFVLEETARRFLAAVRPYDFIGRYGGRSFSLSFRVVISRRLWVWPRDCACGLGKHRLPQRKIPSARRSVPE